MPRRPTSSVPSQAALPLPQPSQRELDVQAQIMGESVEEQRAYLHATLAHVGLPYRDPGDGPYSRLSGSAALVLSPGAVPDPVTGKPVSAGLPYGARPRLMMINLCTQAVQQRSPVVSVGMSLSDFMHQLGIKVTGGEKGTVNRFREQFIRLVSVQLHLFFEHPQGFTVHNLPPLFSRAEFRFSEEPRKRLWTPQVQFSDSFYQALREHALPLDLVAVRKLQRSARALDIYAWLAHRLPRVKGAKTFVGWAALHNQFGPDLTDLKTFKREFHTALQHVRSAYAEAKLDEVDGGLLLRPSPPSISRRG